MPLLHAEMTGPQATALIAPWLTERMARIEARLAAGQRAATPAKETTA